MMHDLRAHLAVLHRGWPVLLLFTGLGLLGGIATALLATPRFDATARVFITTDEADTPLDSLALTVYAQQRLPSYADVASSSAVLRPVALELGLDEPLEELAGRVVATPVPDSLLIEVVASSRFNTEAPALAGAVARQLADVIELQLESRMTTEGSALGVTVVDDAVLPAAPSYPRFDLSAVIGAAAGLFVGIGAMLLLHSFDARIRGVRDVREVTSVRVIGIISRERRADLTSIALDDEHRVAKQFRSFRTDLQFLGFDASNRSVLVVGARREQGTTTAALNLALAMAQLGRRVLLIDAHLRAPEILELLEMTPAPGLTDVLVGAASRDEAIRTWSEVPELSVITAGVIPPNSGDILGSDRMRVLVENLATRYDDVVIDGGSIVTADASALATVAGSTVLVARAGHLRRQQLVRAVDALEATETLVGVLVTDQPSLGVESVAETIA